MFNLSFYIISPSWSNIAGFSSVEISVVTFSPLAKVLNKRRIIFPDLVLGKLSPNRISSGFAIGPISFETHCLRSSITDPTSALVSNQIVTEAAVVGRPHDIKGESIVAFVVLKGERPSKANAETVINDLKQWVSKEIGPIAKPDEIRFGDNLPKTRSGKIMRRLLRTLAKGEKVTTDISTLENPAILDQLGEIL